MKITITSTSKLVTINDGYASMPARIWEGVTESGVPVHCFVTRIAPTIPIDDPRQSEFEAELQECEPPSAGVVSYPARLIL